MGLTIAREIVQAHGGRIWVDTTSDGSRFRFSLPQAAERVPS
jgi:signal transduction histidine kinase